MKVRTFFKEPVRIGRGLMKSQSFRAKGTALSKGYVYGRDSVAARTSL